jgi:hypothetical protein
MEEYFKVYEGSNTEPKAVIHNRFWQALVILWTGSILGQNFQFWTLIQIGTLFFCMILQISMLK